MVVTVTTVPKRLTRSITKFSPAQPDTEKAIIGARDAGLSNVYATPSCRRDVASKPTNKYKDPMPFTHSSVSDAASLGASLKDPSYRGRGKSTNVGNKGKTSKQALSK